MKSEGVILPAGFHFAISASTSSETSGNITVNLAQVEHSNANGLRIWFLTRIMYVLHGGVPDRRLCSTVPQ